MPEVNLEGDYKSSEREGMHYKKRAGKEGGAKSFREIYVTLEPDPACEISSETNKDFMYNPDLLSHRRREFKDFLDRMNIDVKSLQVPKKKMMVVEEVEEQDDLRFLGVLISERDKTCTKNSVATWKKLEENGVAATISDFAFFAAGEALVKEYLYAFYGQTKEEIQSFYRDCRKGRYAKKHKQHYQRIIDWVVQNMKDLGHDIHDIDQQRMDFWKNIVLHTEENGAAFQDYTELFAMPDFTKLIQPSLKSEAGQMDMLLLNDAFQKEKEEFECRWKKRIAQCQALREHDEKYVCQRVAEGAVDADDFLDYLREKTIEKVLEENDITEHTFEEVEPKVLREVEKEVGPKIAAVGYITSQMLFSLFGQEGVVYRKFSRELVETVLKDEN